jgi:hypothetical protein
MALLFSDNTNPLDNKKMKKGNVGHLSIIGLVERGGTEQHKIL